MPHLPEKLSEALAESPSIQLRCCSFIRYQKYKVSQLYERDDGERREVREGGGEGEQELADGEVAASRNAISA